MTCLRLLPALLAAVLAAGAEVRPRAATPPVLGHPEPADTGVFVLPGPVRPLAAAAERPAGHAYPAEFQRDAGSFCQKQIGRWTEADARRLLGPPAGRRRAADDDGTDRAGGHILAFADPTPRFRKLELDFNRRTGLLRGVFVYPVAETWQECHQTWGSGFTVTEAQKGRTFYSYKSHHVDVLVDSAGRVISLGLY